MHKACAEPVASSGAKITAPIYSSFDFQLVLFFYHPTWPGGAHMYQALYRKWRPKTFNDVVGQAHVSQTLKSQVSSDRLSHAYLFVGTRGTGKTSCAKILAKAVNCQKPQGGDPCNTCPSCLGIDNGSILDVLELDAASNNGVDNVRALREEAVFTPVDVKKRVYIIDEVHMLSTAAFNALLKILEEPPEHLIFILATTEIHKVPATILSRCQRYMFKRIRPEDIAERLSNIAAQEKIELTGDAAAMLSRLADGSLRDALSLLDQCAGEDLVDTDRVLSAIGRAGGSDIAALLNAVTDGNVPEALHLLDTLYTNGKVMTAVLEELLNLVRDTLVSALMPNGGSGLLSGGFNDTTLTGFAERLPEARLLLMMELLRQTLMEVSKGSGGKLAAEICLIRLAGEQPDNPVKKSVMMPKEKKAVATTAAPKQEASVTPNESAPAEKTIDTAVDTIRVTDIEQKPLSAEKNASVPSAEPTKDKPQVQVEAPTDGLPEDFWPKVLANIKPSISAPEYSFLSDTLNTSVNFDGKLLTVLLKNAFAAKVIDAPHVIQALKEAAKNILGSPTGVKIAQDKGAEADTSDKLDALKRYSNIKFE